MSQDLKRPVLFDVHRTNNPPLALITKQECDKLQSKRRRRRDEDCNEDACHWDASSQQHAQAFDVPTGALPVVRSPRPVKAVYIPQPERTPTYFRWKRKPTLSLAPTKYPAAPLPHGSTSRDTLSPRAKALQQKSNPHASLSLLSRSPCPPPSRNDMVVTGPSLFSITPLGALRDTDTPPNSTSLVLPSPSGSKADSVVSVEPAQEIAHSRVLTPPVTVAAPPLPKSALFQYTSSVGKLDTEPAKEDSEDAIVASNVVEDTVYTRDSALFADLPPSEERSTHGSATRAVMTATSPVLYPPRAFTPSNLPHAETTAATGFSHSSSHHPTAVETEQPPSLPNSPGAQSHAQRNSATPASSKPAPSSAKSIAFDANGTQQAHDKVIAQHVLRGKFLRKYLHVNNMARKMNETEQALRLAALHGGMPTQCSRNGEGDHAPPSSNSFVVGSREEGTKAVAGLTDSYRPSQEGGLVFKPLHESTPILQRISSVDMAINNTVKRMRRLSGMDTDSPATTANAVPPATTGFKLPALSAIGEDQQPREGTSQASRKGIIGRSNSVTSILDADADDDVVSIREISGGAKMDASSAHMMRVCQHVIAKRTVKAFLRYETSEISILEIAIRDDPSMRSNQAGAASVMQEVGDKKTELQRTPIERLNEETRAAVRAYLPESEHHLTLEVIYKEALAAERGKRWKRAILLASACAIVDREFVLAVVLRARCCRRLGLWVQAVKDVGLAFLLRPEEYKLVLLRAHLYAQMSDLPRALADVNRALGCEPKSTNALLLRASLFDRQRDVEASLRDLTTTLSFDPSCWRAHYDRASMRMRAVDGSEDSSFTYHWEHMTYEHLLASVIEDYVNALRKGCQVVEVVETVGDLSIRLLECTGDPAVLRQVITNFTTLLKIWNQDLRNAFHSQSRMVNRGMGSRPSIVHAAMTAAAESEDSMEVSSGGGNGNGGGVAALDRQQAAELGRELLLASIHVQRGRLLVLLQDYTLAQADFDQAVVTEYHYPLAHFYRSAFATLVANPTDEEMAKTNLQQLSRCIAQDPTIAGAYTVRGALHLRDRRYNNALQDFKAAVTTDPTLHDVWLQIALIFLNHYHDSDACVQACSSALTSDSGLTRVLYLRGEALTRQGNLQAALRDYGRLTMTKPADRWAHLLRGRLLLQMAMPRPALYAFIQFMELDMHSPAQDDDGVTTTTTTTSTDNHTINTTNSSNKRAHLLCGRAYKILTRFKQAVDQFQHAVALNPTAENLVLLSESLHSMGDTENSLRVSEKVITADPTGFRGYVRRAQLLVTIGQLHRALAEYDRALALAPKEAQVVYERGVVHMQLYLRWRVARDVASSKGHGHAPATEGTSKPRRRSAFDPCMPKSSMDMLLLAPHGGMVDMNAVTKGMQTSYKSAIADFCKCIRLDPLRADPYVDRAELYVLGEDYYRAFADFNAAIECNPKCGRAFLNRGVLKCQFAAYAAAIMDFDHAIQFSRLTQRYGVPTPSTTVSSSSSSVSSSSVVCISLARAYFNRGVAYHKLELWDPADRSYTHCIDLLGPGRDTDAHRNRAIARCHLQAFAEALEDFTEVQQMAPDDDQLHGGLGYVLLQLGRYKQAATCFAEYGRLSRDTYADSGNAYFNLAQTQSYLDKKQHRQYLETALRFYVRATRLHPIDPDLRLNLANCLRHLRAPWKAITQCDAIHASRPLHHECLESKALAYYQMNRLEEATEWMNAAIRTCVSSSSALENIFYAFGNHAIRRNALERRTVANSSRGTTPGSRPMTRQHHHQQQQQQAQAHVPVQPGALTEAMQSHLQELRDTRIAATSTAGHGGSGGSLDVEVVQTNANANANANATADSSLRSDDNGGQGIVLMGSSKQMLSLYMLNRGVMHEKLGAWEAADQDYRDALHFDPMAVQALLGTATLQLMRAQYRDSRDTLHRALLLEPRNGLVHLNLSVVLLCLDEVDSALAHCEIAITELPTCSYAYANRAVALARKGQLPRAEQEFKRAIEELPSRREYYLARGKIIAQQKRLQDAMVDFSTALLLGHGDTAAVVWTALYRALLFPWLRVVQPRLYQQIPTLKKASDAEDVEPCAAAPEGHGYQRAVTVDLVPVVEAVEQAVGARPLLFAMDVAEGDDTARVLAVIRYAVQLYHAKHQCKAAHARHTAALRTLRTARGSSGKPERRVRVAYNAFVQTLRELVEAEESLAALVATRPDALQVRDMIAMSDTVGRAILWVQLAMQQQHVTRGCPQDVLKCTVGELWLLRTNLFHNEDPVMEDDEAMNWHPRRLT